ncbi:MAG TPA: heme NO-binding domain-containing protein [Lacibacter sp.]|nr:heme NO-binding domain-containing protein [Lacibacter sp.]HMO90151.1 heme NO-binding domain-containing protein [Lacibacter sp.]HMP85840.1 heme NO-binding domain-containing protein [Lacibacter sp.]
MYGLVNKAIEDLVKEQFGEEAWDRIKLRSGVEVDFFISNEPYDDALTFRLARSVADEMQIPLADVLIAFGEYWVLKTGKEKYSHLMEAGGSTLREFLVNLPQFHNRIQLIYPRLTPPEFRVSHVETNSLRLHYYSTREGLQPFVCGLLQGLGKMFQANLQIEILQHRNAGADHEIFQLSW